MSKNATYGFVLLAAMFFSNGAAWADDSPTLDQVYKATQAGKMDEAQGMMEKVLKEHPDSAKAHFVEAEILVKQGQMGRAEAELNNAERLKPGLPFVKPQTVQDLKNRIAATHRVSQSPVSSFQPEGASNFPWGMVLLGLGAIAIIFFIIRAKNARNPANFPSNYQPGMQPGMQNASGAPVPMQPYGGGVGGGMAAPAAGGGFGGGIMGGLATGAAVGVGMVAGEALAHRFMDGGHNDAGHMANNNAAPATDSWGGSSNDMGGADFGIADNASWSDSSNVADADSGGSDWS